MSFYVNLSSKDSVDIHPQNYGGDFQVELANPMVFHEDDPWEVALTEMTYDAQGFPNVPVEFSQVKLEALNQHELHNCMEKKFYIKAFVQVKRDVWHQSANWKVCDKFRFPALVLPKKYYSWQGFKDAIEAFVGVKKKSFFSFEIKVHEEKLTTRFITSNHAVKFYFSTYLKKFLKIENHSYLSNYTVVMSIKNH